MKYLVIAGMILLGVAPLDGQEPAFALSGAAPARNAGSISEARELYASARYDEALAMLDAIRPGDTAAPAERKIIEQYRSLCLLALGRAGEAETAIAAVVTVDPFYQPSETDASPRVRSTFAEVRQRLLPDLAAARYASAKQAYDRKEFARAAADFRELVGLLDDPQMNGRLADMRTLAAGFVDLAAAAAAPPPAPNAEAPKPSAPAPEAAPAPREPRIFTAEDAGVVPPVTIRQEVPAVPSSIAGLAKDHGVLDIVIDESGRVISVAVRTRVHPVYDTALVNAARDWKYRPAKLNGSPVRFRKLLRVSIRR